MGEELRKRPYKAIDIANFLVKYFNEHQQKITNLMLLKILYYLQADYLRKEDDVPLFRDDIEMWGYGPVVPNVYHSFKENGVAPIQQTYSYIEEDENGDWSIVDADQVELDANDQEEITNLAEKIWRKYNDRPFDLVEKTHEEPMWAEQREAIENGQRKIKYNNEDIHNYFSKAENWPW